MLTSRRLALRYLAAGFALPALAACQAGPAAAPKPTPNNPLIRPKPQAGAAFTPVLASSELALGRNRFAIGLIDPKNQPITSGSVHLEFFKVDQASGNATKKSEGDATFRAVELLNRGLWVTSASFDAVGTWGAQVTLANPGTSPQVGRLAFEVKQAFSSPGYDKPAPRSQSPVVSDVGGDASHLCSSNPPCAFHQVSIAQALESGTKPLVLLFATPAFCTSGTCAPELSAITKLHDTGYADKASFVHVEIYSYPFDQQKPSPTVEEWHLESEPWVFLVDKGGVVRGRFEGAAPVEEIEPSLKSLV